MNDLAAVFFVIAGLSVIWMTVSMFRILAFLRARGEKVNYFLLRVLIFRYINKYRSITVEERGRPGIPYYHFTYAALGALLSALIAIALTAVA